MGGIVDSPDGTWYAMLFSGPRSSRESAGISAGLF